MPQQVRDRSVPQRRLRVEQLEDRRLLAVLTVQNDLDDTLANLAGDGELSLREAIEIANNPGEMIDGFVSNDVEDTIEFAIPFFDVARTIALADGELEISETLTINGPGQDLLTIDAQQQSRVLNFSSMTGNLTLYHLIITGGKTTRDGGQPGFFYNGGGVRFNSSEVLSISHSQIINNSSDVSHAGGIFNRAGNVNILNSRITGNSAVNDGGGIYSKEGEVTIAGSAITGNYAGGEQYMNSAGGGIFARFGDLTLTDSIVSKNTVKTNVTGLVTAVAKGGGISTASGVVSLTSSIVSENSLVSPELSAGGGIYSSEGDVAIRHSTISGNIIMGSSSIGGGISNRIADVTVIDSTISGNMSNGSGGGINAGSGMVSVTDSTISGNNTSFALSRGGGIAITRGQVSLVNSTVTNNYAPSGGGGISTLSFVGAPTMVIENSVVAGNGGTVGANSSGALDIDSLSDPSTTLTMNHSLLGSAGSNQLILESLGNIVGTIENPIDPLLGPLADNGGPTQTHALLPGSPALEAGDPSIVYDPNEFDQRGAPYNRVAPGILYGIPQQFIDIGAYEAQAPPSADFVDDDHLNGQDFLAWQRGFGMTSGVGSADGDSDHDGDVDLSDLAAWRVSYGQTESPPPPMTELSAVNDQLSASRADAVLGTEMFVFGEEDDTEFVSVAAYVEVVNQTKTTSDLRVEHPASEISNALSSSQNEPAVAEDQSWLTDELVERVFG